MKPLLVFINKGGTWLDATPTTAVKSDRSVKR
jgi:hypothetical protein